MNTPNNLDFIEYRYLQEQVSNNPNASSLPELDLSCKEHTCIPPPQLLFCFSSLSLLNLSNNHIRRFSALKLIQGAPRVKELNLSYNNIQVLDDLIELGDSRSLGSLNIIGNPVSQQFTRIKLVESLLFPKKYQSYDPVKVLTATYHMSFANSSGQKKQDIIISKASRDSRSLSAGRQSCLPGGHKSQATRLGSEVCPVPRRTRYPMLTVLNGDIISIGDMQAIMMQKDLNSIICEGNERDIKTERAVRSDKMHKCYIEAYIKRKTRRKEDMEAIPTLGKLAKIMGEENQLELLLCHDRLSYDKRRFSQPDYEEEIWKGPTDKRVKEIELNIGIAEFKEADREFRELQEKKRKIAEEKKKVKKKLHRRNGTWDIGDEPVEQETKPKPKRKEERIEKLTTSSLSGSVSENLNHEDQEFRVTEDNAEKNEQQDVGIMLLEEDDELLLRVENESPSKSDDYSLSPVKANLRKANSLPKYLKETNRSRQVSFDKDDSPLTGGEDSIMVNEIMLLRTGRKTNSTIVGSGLHRMGNSPITWLHPVEIVKEPSPKIEKKKTRGRFVLGPERAPNISLPNETHKKHKSSSSVDAHSEHNTHQRRESVGPYMQYLRPPMPVNIRSIDIDDATKIQSNEGGVTISDNSHILVSNSKPNFETDGNQFFSIQQDSMVKSENSSHRKNEKLVDQSKESQSSSDKKLDPVEGLKENPQEVQLLELASSGHKLPSISQIKEEETEKIVAAAAGNPSKTFVTSSALVLDSSPVRVPQTHQEQSVKHQDGKDKIGSPSNMKGVPLNLFDKVHRTLNSRDSAREVLARQKAQKVREHEKEALKFSKVIFLNRSNSVRLLGSNNKSGATTSTSTPQEKEASPVKKSGKVREQSPLVRRLEVGGAKQFCFLNSQLSKNNNHSVAYLKKGKADVKIKKIETRGGLAFDNNVLMKMEVVKKEDRGVVESRDSLTSRVKAENKFHIRSQSAGHLSNLVREIAGETREKLSRNSGRRQVL